MKQETPKEREDAQMVGMVLEMPYCPKCGLWRLELHLANGDKSGPNALVGEEYDMGKPWPCLLCTDCGTAYNEHADPIGELCQSCGYVRQEGEIDRQYSYGIYAGRMCETCARQGFRDQCGHTEQGQGNPADLEQMGEQINPI